MFSSVQRPLSFILTLVLKDGRQFIISDVKSFYSWSYPSFNLRLELNFYDDTVVWVLFSKIDRFQFSVLIDSEVVPFDINYCDYRVREFADHIILG